MAAPMRDGRVSPTLRAVADQRQDPGVGKRLDFRTFLVAKGLHPGTVGAYVGAIRRMQTHRIGSPWE